MRIALVMPFLNEEEYLEPVLDAVAAQTRPPDEVLLVDDGSTDGSPEIAAAFASRHPYARLIRRPPRERERDRLATAAELRAFQAAVEELDPSWDVVAKIDTDACLSPAALETLEREFEADPRLGLAGTQLSTPGPDGVPVRDPCGPGHVHGAVSFYRRACFEAISPVPAIVGWDMLDEVRARMHGWRTGSFETPTGDTLHLRPMGTHSGLVRAWRRWGEGAYGYGEHPLHVLLYAVRRARDRPRVVGGASYFAGWALAGLRRAPRAEPELRAYVRREQRARIRRRLSGLPAAPGARETSAEAPR